MAPHLFGLRQLKIFFINLKLASNHVYINGMTSNLQCLGVACGAIQMKTHNCPCTMFHTSRFESNRFDALWAILAQRAVKSAAILLLLQPASQYVRRDRFCRELHIVASEPCRSHVP
jgi:hypothetical protein